MSELKKNHNHPVVFRGKRRQPTYKTLAQPAKMSDQTFQRIQLMMAYIKMGQLQFEPYGSYINRVAREVEMDPVAADLFLKGALYRKDV